MDDGLPKLSKLTQRQERAAALLAADELTNDQIAASVKITRQGLAKWQRRLDFAARVAEHRKAWRDAIMKEGIADRVRRVRVLARLEAKYLRVIEKRATDPAYTKVPGGDTGLFTRKLRTVRGPDGKSEPLWEYSVDNGTVAELRAVHEQAAKELGQWVDKFQTELRGDDLKAAIRRELARLSLPLMQQAIARAKAREQRGESVNLDEVAKDVDRELRRLVGLADGDVPSGPASHTDTVH